MERRPGETRNTSHAPRREPIIALPTGSPPSHLPVRISNGPGADTAGRGARDCPATAATGRVDVMLAPEDLVELHPAAELMPRLRPAQLRALLRSVDELGVREPVVLSEGRLLDGQARLHACRELDTDCPAIEIGPVDDPVGLVLALNVQRRHLRACQLALLAARLCDRPRGGSAIAYAYAMGQARAGRLLGVSRSAIGLARRILRSGETDLIEALEAGTMPLRRAIAALDERTGRMPGRSGPSRARELASSRGRLGGSPPDAVRTAASAGLATQVPAVLDGSVPDRAGTSPTPLRTRQEILDRLLQKLRVARRLGPDDETSDRDGYLVLGQEVPEMLLDAASGIWECDSRQRIERLRGLDPEARAVAGWTSAIERPDLECIERLAIGLEQAFRSTLTGERECPLLPHLLWPSQLKVLKGVCERILQALEEEAARATGPDGAADGPLPGLEDDDEDPRV